jgi:hypothetical protein
MAELLSCYKSEQLRDLAVLLKILDSELSRRELAGTDPPTPVASAASAVIPHPRLTAEAAEQSLRPAG